MACQSIAPIFSFKELPPATRWPTPPPSPINVLGDAKGEDDPLKKILGFTCNLGLGSSSSTLSIDMSGFHLDAEKSVGKFCIFKCDKFGFGGMIKSVTHSENRSGQKTKIDMTDMKEGLARYDLFLNEWSGTTDSYRKTGSTSIFYDPRGWNTKNVHRSIEGNSWGNKILSNYGDFINESNYSRFLPDVGNCNDFGIHTDGKVSQFTTTYSKILDALVTDPAYLFNTYTYPVRIWLNIIRDIAKNEIPYVGTNAKTMTLLDLINNVCEEAGYDWTFHTPVDNSIRIRLIDKKPATTFGEVKNRIESAKQNNKLLSYSIGAEFKNEKTRKIVVGSKVNYIKQLYFAGNNQTARYEDNPNNEHKSAYVLGFDDNNFPITAFFTNFNGPRAPADPSARPFINIRTLSTGLQASGFGGFGTSFQIAEAELLSTGTIATWKLFGILYPESLSGRLMAHLGIDRATAQLKIKAAIGSNTHNFVQSCVEAVKFTTRKNIGELLYEELCYPWIKNFYDTWYGKYYMVIIPKPVCYFDPSGFIGNTDIFLGSGGAGFLSDEPTDSGWWDNGAESYPPLGLHNFDKFRDSNGKVSCFCRIDTTDFRSRVMNGYNPGLASTYWYFDPTGFQGDYVVQGKYIYVKAEIDGRAYNYDGGTKLGVLIKMPNMITARWDNLNSNANTMGLRMLEMLTNEIKAGGGGTTDYSFANVFKETFAAGTFDSIAVPMKSNVVNYGPWLSHPRATDWSDGGVELKLVEDLNPWSYGGYNNMNTAGNKLAIDGVRTRTKYESGSITIAETPQENMEAGGTSKVDPIISSIVCKIDSSGATTTYNYQTYVQKFGQSAEAFNEFTKLNISNRRNNFNAVKEMNDRISKAFTDGIRTFGTIRDKFFEQAAVPLTSSSASLNNVLILSYPDGSNYQRIEAGIDKKYTSDYFQDQLNYQKYAIVSLDMFFSPVVTSPFASSPYMPSITPALGNITNYPLNATKPRLPPIGTAQIIPIQNIHLNPYTSAGMMGAFGTAGGGSGFRTEYIAFGSVPANTFASNQAQVNLRDSQSAFRGAALRGPLLLHSWGYDINGYPVPGNQQGSFNQNWLANPGSWPCGPIDLRWDPARAVWVCPPSASLVIGTLQSDLLPGGTAIASVQNVAGFYNVNIPGGLINVYDFIGEGIPKGANIVAYHFGSGPDYIVLNHSDSFIKGDAGGCTDSPGVGEPIQQQNGYLQGFGRNGRPALYSIAELFSQPNLAGTAGKKQVLGYEELNDWGFPCMISIPVVDCSGNAPQNEFDPI